MAEQLKDAEELRVIVENKPGAIQSIGAAEALKCHLLDRRRMTRQTTPGVTIRFAPLVRRDTVALILFLVNGSATPWAE